MKRKEEKEKVKGKEEKEEKEVNEKEKMNLKAKGEEMTGFCSFLRKYSHQGPQDNEEAELSERYTS